MTSTDDGKDLKSISTSPQKGKAYYIELYKNLEARLSSKSSCGERVTALSDAWRRICELCQHSSQATQKHLLAWLQTHTAGVLLQAEWQSPQSIEHHSVLKNVLDSVIQQIDQDVTSKTGEAQFWEAQLVLHAQRFKRMISEPWGHPVLRMLLNTQGDQPDDEQIVEWLSEEKGVMLVARLRQLASAKCQDLALAMITAIMDRVRDHKSNADEENESGRESVVPYNTNCTEGTFVDRLNKNADFTQDVWESLTDMEFVLLHRLGKANRCKSLVKHLCLRGVRRLIDRLRGRLESAPNDKKLWKNAKDVAILITGAVVHRCMMIPCCSGVTAWALTYCTRVLLLLSAGRPADYALYVKEAVTARHLHTFTVAVETVCKESESMRSFVCELYIHTLTYGMNELQPLKDKPDKESEARTVEKTLCTWFVQLGDFLRASDRIHAECLLTAFSVHPSEEMYSKLVGAPDLPRIKIHENDSKEGELKSVYGSWAHDSSTKTNFVKTSETLNLKQTTRQANVLSSTLLSEGEGLGLGPELCSDLASLLGGPRVKTLSWDMDRDILLENCRTYMERTGGGTKSLVTELKYLNLDPSEVEHLPEEDEDENDIYYGIEKGYEHLVEFQDSPEALWEDSHALLFPSTDEECNESVCSTSSYYDYDIGSKKTHKKKLDYPDKDRDPLSLNTEIKKKERSRSKDTIRNEIKKEERSQSKDKQAQKDRSTHKSKRKSKERSRERRKDRSLSKEKTSNKSDDKKRHHKKKEQSADNIDKTATSSSLSGLIGMKVCSLSSDPSQTEIKKKICKKKERRRLEKEQKRMLKEIKKDITDSDYDSQGKSSLTSLATTGTMDSDVLLDGFFSIDETCSPEKNSISSSYTSQPTTMTLVNSHELSMTNGSFSIKSNVNISQGKPVNVPLNVLSKSDSNNSLISTQSTNLIDAQSEPTDLSPVKEHKPYERQPTILNLVTQKEKKPFMVHVNTLIDTPRESKIPCTVAMKTDVKSTVARLIEFRKQKNTSVGKTTTMNVKVLDPHNVYKNLNKTQAEPKPLAMSSDNLAVVPMVTEEDNKSHTHMPVTANRDNYATYLSKLYPQLQLNPVIQDSKKNVFSSRIVSSPSTSVKNPPKVNSEKITSQTSLPKGKSTKYDITLANAIQKGAISINKTQQVNFDKRQQVISDVEQTNKVAGNMHNLSGNVIKQKSIQDFVKELQETINAGTCGTKKSSGLLQNTAQTVQCAKIPQKKVDDAPNTFARLCYMHKNKQNDSGKLKQPVVNTPVPVLQSKLNVEQCPVEHKLSKLKTLQTRGHLTVSLRNSPKSPIKGSADVQQLQKTKISDTASEVTPILSTLLSNTNPIPSKQINAKSSNIHVQSPAYDTSMALTQTMIPSPHHQSALSISDQLELQRLLWQRNKLNANIVHTIKTKPDNSAVAKLNPVNHNIQHPFYGLNSGGTESINNSLLIQNRPSAIVQNNYQKTVSCRMSNISQSNSGDSIGQSLQCDTKPKIVRKPRHISNSIQIPKKTVHIQEVKNDTVDSVSESDIPHKKQISIDQFRNECKLKSNSKDFKIYEVQQDWESVLNELLSHQTPSRGENALDLKLRKDYIRDKTKNKMNKDDVINQRIIKTNTNTRLLENKLTLTKSKQTTVSRSSKIPPTSQVHSVHSSSVSYSSPVSGVDGPLLDEEIDKDLLREIDELTSDEESYPNSSSELSRSKQNDTLKVDNKGSFNETDKTLKYVSYSRMKKGTLSQSKEFKKQGKFMLKMDSTKSATTQPQSCLNLVKSFPHNSKVSVMKCIQQQSDCDKVGTKSLSKIMTPCRTVDNATVGISSGVEKPKHDNTLLGSESLSRKIDLNANNDLKNKVLKNDDSLILVQTTSANICLPLRTAEAQKQIISTNYNQMHNQYVLNSQVITEPKILYCSDIESENSVNKFTKNIVTSDYEIINKRQVGSSSGNLNYQVPLVPPSSSNMLSVVANVHNVPLNILVTPLIQNTSNLNVTKSLTSKEIDLKSENRTALLDTCHENNHLNVNKCHTIDDNKHMKLQTGNLQNSHLPKVKEPVDNYKYKGNQSNINESKYEIKSKLLSVVDDCKHKKYQTKSDEHIDQSILTMSETIDKSKKHQINSHQNIHQPKLKVAQQICNYKTKEHYTSTNKNIDQVNVNPSLVKDNYKHKEYQIIGNENIHQSAFLQATVNKQLPNESKFKKYQTSSHGLNQSKIEELQTTGQVDYREKEFQISTHKSCPESKVKAVQSVDNFKILDYKSSNCKNEQQSKIKATNSSDNSKHVEFQKDNCENICTSKINVHQVIDDSIRKKYQAGNCESVLEQKLMKTQALNVNKHKECHNNFNIFQPQTRKYVITNENKPEEYQTCLIENICKLNTKKTFNNKEKQYQICHTDNFCKSNIKVNSDKGKEYQTCHVDNACKINVKEVANDKEKEYQNTSSQIKKLHTVINMNEIPNHLQSTYESKLKETNPGNIQDDKQMPLNTHISNIKSPLIVRSTKSEECQNSNGDDIHRSKVKEIQDINKHKGKECQTSINIDEPKVNSYQLVDNNIDKQYLSNVENISQIESNKFKAKDIKEHEQYRVGFFENEQITETLIVQDDKKKNHQNSLENINQLERKECPDIENSKNNQYSTSRALCVISNKLNQTVNTFLDTLIDKERLKNKRLSIVNREINKKCHYPPIPLRYYAIGKNNNINLVEDFYSQKSLVSENINTKVIIKANSKSKISETGSTSTTKNEELFASNSLLDDKTFPHYENIKSPLTNKEVETPMDSCNELKNLLNSTSSCITEQESTNENVVEKKYSQSGGKNRILLGSLNKINVKNVDKNLKKATLKSTSQIAKVRIKMFKTRDELSHCTVENIDNPTKSINKNLKLKRTPKKNNLSTVKVHPYVYKNEDISKIDKPQQTSVTENNSNLCTHAESHSSDGKTEDANDLPEISVRVNDENKHSPDKDENVAKKSMTDFEFIDIEEAIQCSKIPKILCPSEPILTNTDLPCTKRKRRTKVKSVKIRNNGEDKNYDKNLSNSLILNMENDKNESYKLSNESKSSPDILLGNNPLPIDNINAKSDKLNENPNRESHSESINSMSDRDLNLICESTNALSTSTENFPFEVNSSNNNESKKINQVHETGFHVNRNVNIDSRTDKTLPFKYSVEDDNNSAHHTQQVAIHKKTHMKNISLCTSNRVILNKNLKHKIRSSSSSLNKKLNFSSINSKKHPKRGRQSDYKNIGKRKIVANINDAQNVRTKRTHESNSIKIIKSSSNAARIVLSNGRTFKATVVGNTDFNVDELLSNPNLRRKISDQIKDNKKYTLNIRTIPKIRTRRGSKYMEATVKSVDDNIIKLPITEDVETVNLISDDEDEQDTCESYVTEFGSYKVSPVKKSVSLMHQNKFNQKSLVRLERIDFASSSPCLSNTNINSKEKVVDPDILDLTVSSDDEENINFNNKDSNSKPINTLARNESIKDDALSKTTNIEILPNNNKGTSLFENFDALRTTCDRDVSGIVISDCNEAKLQAVETVEKVIHTFEKDIFVNINENPLAISEEQSTTTHKSDSLDNIHESKQIQEIETDNKSHNRPDEELNYPNENSPKYNSQPEIVEPHNPITNKSHNYNNLNIKPCSVKILKCDEILHKIQNTNKRKCYVKLEKCNHWEENQNNVMKVDSDMKSNIKNMIIKYQTAECLDGEQNISQKKVTTNSSFSTQLAYKCTSPVMEVFEILASYNCKVDHEENENSVTGINSNVELQLETSCQIQCKAEWCFTKRKYNLLFKKFLFHHICPHSNALAPVFHDIVATKDILDIENNQMTSSNMNISNEITVKKRLLKPINVNNDLLTKNEINIFSANRDTENENCFTIGSIKKDINVNDNFSELLNVDSDICDTSLLSKLPENSCMYEKTWLVGNESKSKVQTQVSSLLAIVLKVMNDCDFVSKLTSLNSAEVLKSNLHNISLKRKLADVEINIHTKKLPKLSLNSKLVRTDCDLSREGVLIVNGINLVTENDLNINSGSPINNEIDNKNLHVNGFQKDVLRKSINICKSNTKDLAATQSCCTEAVVFNVHNGDDTDSIKNALIISDNIKENENELQEKINDLNCDYNDTVKNLMELESMQATISNFVCNDNSQDNMKGAINLDENKLTSDEIKTSPDIIETVVITTKSHTETGRQDCLRSNDMDNEDIRASSTSLNIIKTSEYQFYAKNEPVLQNNSDLTTIETDVQETNSENSDALSSPFDVLITPNKMKFCRSENILKDSYLKYPDHEYVTKLSNSTLSQTILSKCEQNDSNNIDVQDECEELDTVTIDTTYANVNSHEKSEEEVYSCYDVITIQIDDYEDEIISTFLACSPDSENEQHIMTSPSETTLSNDAENSNVNIEWTEKTSRQSNLTSSESYNYLHNSDSKSEELALPVLSPKALNQTNINNSVMVPEKNKSQILFKEKYVTPIDHEEDNKKHNILNTETGSQIKSTSKELLDTFDGAPEFQNKFIISEKAHCLTKNLEETAECINHEEINKNLLANEELPEKVKIEAGDENAKDTISLYLKLPHIDMLPSKKTPVELVEKEKNVSKIKYDNFSESIHSNKTLKGEEQQSNDRALELLGNDVDPFNLQADTSFNKDLMCLENNQENVTVIGNVKEQLENVSEMPNNNFNSTGVVHGMELNSELLDVIPPCKTYSTNSLKRKNETRLIGTNFKKFRKGKNIDVPKFSKSSIQSTSYKKQFNNLSNYSSSLKFSYYQFFGRGYCEIEDLKIQNWPLTSNWNPNCSSFSQNENEGSLLFTEYDKYEQDSLPAISLADEMSVEQLEKDVPLFESNEHIMNMGFGEESGRVILNSKSIINTTKRSAATLSDVKRSQPCPPSEDCENNKNITNTILNTDKSIVNDDKFMYLRLVVKKFFENMKINENFFNNNRVVTKQVSSSEKLCRMLTNVPGLYGTEFIRPHITEQIVQVVQVGQLPVSAAAQNPVSCDSRVSQVTDASPSQCSVENSPHSGMNDNAQTNSAKTNEYTELTTADLSMPIVQDIDDNADQTIGVSVSQNSNMQPLQNVHIEINNKTEESENVEQVSQNHCNENNVDPTIDAAQTVHNNNVDYRYDNTSVLTSEPSVQLVFNASAQHNISEQFIQQKQENGSLEKNDQIANAMNAAGIATTNTRAHTLVNILSQKIIRPATVSTAQTATNSYSKTTSINAMAIQQALAQILPPPLNQTSNTENAQPTPQVLHIVQGKNSSGNQITLLDNSQQSVISSSNATQVLHIVQNKNATGGTSSNGAQAAPPNSFSGLSLVDTSLPPGGSQLLHIVNTGNNQKNNNTGQLLKRVNLLTNIANVQGGNEQKMVQFVCKSADGKAIQLNAPHQRSMVLRLQPIERPPVQTVTPKQADTQAESPTNPIVNSLPPKDTVTTQQEIKSRSVYEENYAKFIQNSSTKQSVVLAEKSTSLPKFNQAFGKPVFQDGVTLPKQNEIAGNSPHIPAVNNTTEATDCTETPINLDHIGQISSPPLLLRKSPAQTSQPQPNIVQQIKQTISPMNIQTMHGGVIYTRQIPVNIGGGQTINLITVPSTELIDETTQKQSSDVKFVSQGEIEPSIIKIVPQSQTSNEESASEDNGQHSNINNDGSSSQPQPVLTQMRIKLPMLSKTPQVPGARMVRPSLFQIQRNVIGGANQPVYQQLVLTAAPPLGQQTIRLPQSQVTRQIKVPTDNQTESQLSSSTLEQLREFDMVLEQVKERSTVHPGSGINTFTKLHTSPSDDTTDSSTPTAVTPEHPQQVLYSIGGAQALNVTYVTRKPAITTPTTVAYVRSPDSTGIADSPSPQIAQNVPDSPVEIQHKPAKINSKSVKSRPSKPSSTPPNSMKVAPVPPKTSAQKPLEDEQTTQRILYILAEYKEQVENSPDKDKPAPRRRSNPPSNPSGSSKRKKSSSGSRRPGGNGRDSSPVTSEDPGRTMGSEDSSCGTSQGDCNENCGADTLSPQDSPRKVARKLPFEQESAPATPAPQARPQPQRNVIVADGQTIAVARGAAGKPATAVLMPANYILPVSMVKGGQQIAIVTNRGPKLLTVGATGAGAESGAANALLLQRLIGPTGLKPVLTRPGVRHVRLPTTALHNLQAFNLAAAVPSQPTQANEPATSPSSASAPTPPESQDTGQPTDSWQERDRHVDAKNVSGASPEGADAWRLPSAPDPHDYTYDEPAHRTGMDRPVLVVNKKDASGHSGGGEVGGGTLARAGHASAAALRHKYAMLEHELRLQKSLSEECEDLGVDSPSASELFPEADLLFAASPAHDHGHDNTHTSQSTLLSQSGVPQPDLEDQIATDHLLPEASPHGAKPDLVECSPGNDLESGLSLGDVGVVTVSALNHEEFARSHPNTTFHSEPTDDAEVQPFSMSSLKGRHITSTIFHSGTSAPTTVLMTAAAANAPLKYTDIDNVIDSMAGAELGAGPHGLTRFDNMLSDTRELHLGSGSALHTAPAGAAAHVIRRVCYDNDKSAASRYLLDEPDTLIAGDDPKISVVEDSSRDATLESIADDDRSSPERHAELFWESNSASERSESRRPLDFSSDSDKCCKSPSLDETNSTDSSGLGARLRLDTVIKEARGRRRSGSADGSSADDAAHPPVRTYPAKRPPPSLTGKTRAGDPPHQPQHTVRRRASGRGVVKRGCHCCNGSPAPPHHTSIGIGPTGAGPPRPKKPRTRRPPATAAVVGNVPSEH